MSEACPCCREGGTDNGLDCVCVSMPDVYCELIPMAVSDIIMMFIKKKYWNWFEHPYLMWQFSRRMKRMNKNDY